METRISAEYCYVKGGLRRSKKQISIRGLNKDHNHDLKGLFKGAATRASVLPGPFQDFYQRSLAKGIKPTMSRLTLARRAEELHRITPTEATPDALRARTVLPGGHGAEPETAGPIPQP